MAYMHGKVSTQDRKYASCNTFMVMSLMLFAAVDRTSQEAIKQRLKRVCRNVYGCLVSTIYCTVIEHCQPSETAQSSSIVAVRTHAGHYREVDATY